MLSDRTLEALFASRGALLGRFALVLAFLAAGTGGAREAAAAQYAKKGIIEIGGSLAFDHNEISVSNQARSLQSMARFALIPTAQIFVVDQLALRGSAGLSWQKVDSGGSGTDATSTELSAGFAYASQAGPVFLEPSVRIGFERSESRRDELRAVSSGMIFGGAIALKVPVGGGGMVSMGPSLSLRPFTYEMAGQSAELEESRFQLNLGYSIFF